MKKHIYTNPKSYSENNKLQFNFAMSVLNRANIHPTAMVLDLGCGDGQITFEIAKMAYDGWVVGADISEKMVEHANHLYRSQKNLRFISMDTSKNAFKNQFDVITSFNSLHWVKDQANALRGISLAAILNAKIILLFSHRKSVYHETLDTLCTNTKWVKYFNNFTNPRLFIPKEEYREILLTTGFEIISLEEKEMTYEFNSTDSFKAFLAASMANIKQIPSDHTEDFLEDFVIEYLKQSHCQNNHQIPLSFWCLEVFALKK